MIEDYKDKPMAVELERTLQRTVEKELKAAGGVTVHAGTADH